MAKVSTSLIRRPQPEILDRTLTDQRSGITIPLRLRRLGVMELVAALDLARERATLYVTGRGEPGSPGYEPPTPFPPVDGQPVHLSESTCRVASALEYAQACDSDDDRYSFEELVSFMTLDAICDQASEAFEAIQPVEASSAEGEADPLASSGPRL